MQERAYSPKAIAVSPYAAEVPLRILLTIVGVVLWILIIGSIIGLFYGIVLGLLFFFAHLILIAHVRGSSIKLGPQQMPGLYNRVVDIAQRMGMKRVPDVYLQQSGGVLNAFATRLGRRRFVVLFSDLVKACGENLDALDFIIAHELGHIHRGHLNWRWLHWPAMFIPFLGTAYSRACEYTCDRYGFQAPSDPRRSLDGLCILAAGPQFVPFVNKQAFVAQRDDLNTAFMKLASWFSTHPPLARRVAALSPDLAPKAARSGIAPTFFALLMATVLVVVPVAGGIWALAKAIEDARQNIATQLGAASRP
ncbi:MAG: M48 family metallopeptidase [Bradyrhizobiaceae bacterium]|nr:M48 family metallopeptidase [Bradyrhizobiaceae bacterium]